MEIIIHQKEMLQPDMMAHACNHSIWERKITGSGIEKANLHCQRGSSEKNKIKISE